MNAPPSIHPSEQTLSSFALGKLDDASSEAVNNHLEQCPDCRKRAAEMSADSFLERVRGASARPDSPAPIVSPVAGVSVLAGGPNSPAPPPKSTLPPGLADHPDYEILRELGRGGMGLVYLAQNKLMGRTEVLKVVGGHLINRPGVLERFQREIRSAANLHHTNIVTAYAALRAGESLVFAMEYVEGYDLAQLVRGKGPLQVAHACNFAHQAALGLQYAHEKGMVHRDIKPSNLMVAREGKKPVVKVLDFGLAKVTSEGAVDGGLTHEGQMLGTPDYIAPEQISNARRADIRADIYSLGCTLYYLLTGKPPFQGDSLYDILQAQHSMDATPVNLVRPEVPVEVAAIVAKMMAKEPSRRFQTPKEVAEALKPFFKAGSVGLKGPKPEVSQASPPDVGRRTARTASEPAQPATDAVKLADRSTKPADMSAVGSRWESLIDLREGEQESLPSLPPRPTGQPPRRWWPVALAASLFGLLALGVIIITIRDRSGRETARFVVPEGSTATIEQSPGGTGTVQEAPASPPRSEAAGNARTRTAAVPPGGVKPAETVSAPETGRIEGDRVILAKLERAIPMKYPNGAPLESVLKDIRKATAGPDGAGIPIFVDPVGLQAAKKTIASQVTIDVEGIPLKTTLGLVLRSMGLDYCVGGGVLLISDEGEGGNLADAVAQEPRRTIGDGSRESDAVMAKLGASIPVRFAKGTPLASLRKYITDATRGPNGPGIPVFVDPNGLKEAGKSMDSPVSVDLEGVPLRTTLVLMLHQLGLKYYVERGLLRITSVDDVPEWLVKQAEKNKPPPDRFDALLARVAHGLKLSAPAIGLFGWPMLRAYRGREDVLWTHPVSKAIPFVMSCPLALPPGRKTTLFLEVSCFDAWNLVVKANNRTLHDSIINHETTRGGWATVEVDLTGYAGSTVNLEVEGGEGDAYWARIEIVSEADTGAVAEEKKAAPPAPPARTPGTGRDSTAPPRQITNSIRMKLVLIPAGEFVMGSPEDDKDADNGERPQHGVRITRPFYLGVTEVTQAQFMAVMGYNPSHFSANGGGRDRVAGQSTESYPVEMVSWFEAVGFCNKLSEKEGRKPFYEIDSKTVHVPDWNRPGYRLPTEAEWEYACRANSKTRYSFGDDPAGLVEHAWYDGTSGGRTHPVGQKGPNDFGLFDMHGNVREWCWDGSGNYEAHSPVIDPLGPSGVAHRVIRGGNLFEGPRDSRSARRDRRVPEYRGNALGFRVARVQSLR